MQHGTRILDAADAACDAERDVDDACYPLHPVAAFAAPLWAGGDVVEHQLVRALLAVTQRELDDIAHVDVVAEPYALDHSAVAHVQARDDAAAQHARSSRSDEHT